MTEVIKCKSQIKHRYYKIFNQYNNILTMLYYFSYKNAREMTL